MNSPSKKDVTSQLDGKPDMVAAGASRALRDAAPDAYRVWLRAAAACGTSEQVRILAARLGNADAFNRSERAVEDADRLERATWEDLMIATGRDHGPAIGGDVV